MTTTASFESLPEDLEPIQTARSTTVQDLMVRIGLKNIGLTAGAHRALGKPERIEILFGQGSRMLAIRGCQTGGYKVAGRGNAVQIMTTVVCRIVGLGPPPEGRRSHAFPARLVEGALLIGPLPEAGS